MIVIICLWLATALAVVTLDLRFWRVAQREHYLPGRGSHIAALWTKVKPVNLALLAVAAALVVASIWLPALGIAGVLGLAVWPLGLGLKGRTSSLAWTARMRRLAAVTILLQTVVGITLGFSASWGLGHLVALTALLALPLMEVAVAVMDKVEKRMAGRFVVAAKQRLRQVAPTVVAITGSYGKTSTKGYVAHLLSKAFPVVASPASFNNLMGLSRAVNDRLVPGTEVFVAEMGTYGPGEIRELCREFAPDVAAITTIGEAHLERMKSRATIAAAKAEITEEASRIVLNVDVPELAELAHRLAGAKQVVRVSATDPAADVAVLPDGDRWRVLVRGEQAATMAVPFAAHATNVAVALGIATILGVDPARWTGLLDSLPHAEHRAEAARDDRGVWIIDDTYNSNPVGAKAAVESAVERAGEHRVFVVTPGMVELGSQQALRNRELGRLATSRPTMTLAVVGLTNKAALAADAVPAQTRHFATRDEAVAAIVAEAQPGDVILYENDLPDHYA